MAYTPGDPSRLIKPDEKRLDKFRDQILSFAEKHDLNSKQLETAYLLALGTPEEDEEVQQFLSEEVKELSKIINKASLEGVPLNEIGDMIAHHKGLEESKQNFTEWVSGLDISIKEKNLIASIIEKRRVGVLTFVDRKTGDDLFDFEIPKSSKESSSTPVWAYNFEILLKDAIKKSTDGKFEIWFVEKN
ncbi:MAG: hypothetical protein ACD_18C00209G0004 [uncultured bacterium]|uniref:Uncharacterized protein n=1 Tax=Candidatus Magasanikbacteria bacterium RIFOXYC12_FULL_33_11 TaxID=1798701 RepID=A0A1F6NM20_9BACT|nr:MAG: hypothetical protein ACD_18C00209G0004 [uncultured bacterium]OGH84992.1 MAG: hypothetical protein A2493_01410 [Candidatus Magasanikbacteria bacterium RIFOXYC12_FULL_33_11]OGH89054.1 MAG: hypothetical protein A2507_04935 [Candidatus Magasanikbacteria bacterium RIFOXYD12_FULL_33_17]HAO52701.1 hypothetical protein [Candidatus Magasanikbacteria bacterium]